jgi:hypothetical protein
MSYDYLFHMISGHQNGDNLKPIGLKYVETRLIGSASADFFRYSDIWSVWISGDFWQWGVLWG